MLTLLSPLLAIVACTEQEFAPVSEGDGSVVSEPDIRIEPDRIDFSPAEVGARQEAEVVVSNLGTVDLNISNIVVSGSTAFTLGTDRVQATLAPGAAITLPISFSPANPDDFGTITVTSDDPDTPLAAAQLTGVGLIPQLFVSPNPYGFGAVMVDCQQSHPLTMSNLGNATLVVDLIVSNADGFELSGVNLPISLEPGESQAVELGFRPESDVGYGGDIWFSSNSLVETTVATVSGQGTYDPDVVDDFWQGDGPWDRADIFFYVDQSGSMHDDIANMTANFQSFMEMLSSLDLDWQVMITTTDSGCNNTGILSPDVPNADALFLEGADGFAGRFTEAGLSIAANGMKNTQAGECNEGFIRENSKTTLVLVSDEPDQSSGLWSNYVQEIQSYAPTAAITAIVGDVPNGCSTAEAGTGYYEAAAATQGAFLSICESDWSTYFQAIATLSSTGSTDRFPLSSTPDPASIVVSVDGTSVSGSWSYDAAGNAVVFDSDALPASGAHVQAEYTILGDCTE